MRNMYLTATEEKIKRIQFYKSVGKVVYSLIVLTLIIILFLKLDTVMKMQVDALDQMNYMRQDVETLRQEGQTLAKVDKVAVIEGNELIMDTFVITHYCLEDYPHICNNGSSETTASGQAPIPYYTVAADKSIPFGTKIIIDGKEYEVMDRGGAIKGNRIDIAVDTHAEALNRGKLEREVILLN